MDRRRTNVLQQVYEIKPFVLKTDVSDFSLGVVLLQEENEDEIRLNTQVVQKEISLQKSA
ncbi:unnamed protein product [Ceratitis capitata]|uniref:(Mediterranean fruit fly) hypothetical protein n=1 Tax=Ceratitis capitata TaxID=7213 RepID=A0A811URG2_CERCA|nr:unnamed protein product [Ceratitis capitata]